MRSSGPAVANRRRHIGKNAAQSLTWETFEAFITALEAAELSPIQTAKIVALVIERISFRDDGSAFYGTASDATAVFSTFEEPRRLCVTVNNLFGVDTADEVLRHAVSQIHYPTSFESLTAYTREMFYIAIVSPENSTSELVQAIINHSGVLASESSKPLEQQIANLLEEIVSQVGGNASVTGSSIMEAVDAIARSRGASPTRWDQVIKLLLTGGDMDSGIYRPTFGFEDTAFFASLFTSKIGGEGFSNLDGLFAKYDEPEYQLTALRILATTPSLAHSFATLPANEKVVDAQDLSASLQASEIPINIKTAIQSAAAQSETSFWNMRKLVPALLQKQGDWVEAPLLPIAKYLLELGSQQATELVLLGLIDCDKVRASTYFLKIQMDLPYFTNIWYPTP